MKKELKYLIYTDLYKCSGKATKKQFISRMFNIQNPPGFKILFYYRICHYLQNKSKNIFEKIFLRLLLWKYRKLQIKFGIELSHVTKIGPGFEMPHFSGIVINGNTVFGKNCSVLQNVTIGNNLYKDRHKTAMIGDNVAIAAGAKIIGPITIGNNVTIGANAVVTKDIPDDVVVAGIPAKIIAHKKSIVLNTDYLTEEEFFVKK